jgi:hypothetical protein
MCIYVQVFCKKYLHIPTALCVTILLYFARNTCIYCAGFCAGFCAVASPSARTHRRRIAVASPSHRHIASAPHRVAARNAGDLPTSLELHMPVVQPTRCTRTEEVEPQQRALGEAMMRTHVEVMVERL